jgi:hypothetical protein
LPGSNAPVGSSRTSKCRHVGFLPTSALKAENDLQRWHTLPHLWIASHAANTGDMRRTLLLRALIDVP